ncbi:15666_t:CDS:2, partial [Funneliformis geosporum]
MASGENNPDALPINIPSRQRQNRTGNNLINVAFSLAGLIQNPGSSSIQSYNTTSSLHLSFPTNYGVLLNSVEDHKKYPMKISEHTPIIRKETIAYCLGRRFIIRDLPRYYRMDAPCLVNFMIIDGFAKHEKPGSLIDPMETKFLPSRWYNVLMSFGLIMAGFT